jgi:hypothetical protein
VTSPRSLTAGTSRRSGTHRPAAGGQTPIPAVDDDLRLDASRGVDTGFTPSFVPTDLVRAVPTAPGVASTAGPLRATSFTLDGEAVVCGPDGVAIFDALHRRGTASEAMLYAFDLLELNGEDLRALPLGGRKKRLARLLGKRRVGIVSPP